jgi:hypothetical protein
VPPFPPPSATIEEERMSESETPGRREFLKTLGLAGLSSSLIPNALAWAQTPPAGSPAAAPKGMPAAADTSKAPPKEEISEDAKALASIVKRRYGKFLNDEQMKTITEDLDGTLKSAQRLHSVKLANGDEPDTTFHA